MPPPRRHDSLAGPTRDETGETVFELDRELRVLSIPEGVERLAPLSRERVEGRSILAVLAQLLGCDAGRGDLRTVTVELQIGPGGALARLRGPGYLHDTTRELRRQREVLARIAEFVDGLLGDLRARDLEQRIARRLAESLDAEAVALFTHLPGEATLAVTGVHGRRFAGLRSARLSPPLDLDLAPGRTLGSALAERLGLEDTEGIVGAALGPSCAGFVLVALAPRSCEEAMGETADFLSSTGHEISLVLENAVLAGDVSAARRRTDVVRELAASIAQSLDTAEVWQVFADELQSHLPTLDLLALATDEPLVPCEPPDAIESFDGAANPEPTPQAQQPRGFWVSVHGSDTTAPKAVFVTSSGGGLLERAMHAEKSLAAEDLGASRHPGDVQLADLGFGWSVAVPLFARADRVGILVAGGRHRGPPGEDERLLVEQAAAHLAPALANARIHQRLVDLHARLVRLDHAKDTLSSLVVHDLRGPLAVATANVQFLHDLVVESSDGDGIAALGDAEDALESAADTIRHLLDIAHLEEARMPCDPRPVDPGVLAEELIRSYARIAQRKGVRLSLQSAAGVFPIDDGLITRMLRNLIGNALRHTPAGGEVAVRIRGVEDRLEISVADDGPGIPESQRSALFSKFARLSDRQKNPGYGLGLHFVKLAAEAHGGSVRFEPAPGGGSIFFVELPRRQPG